MDRLTWMLTRMLRDAARLLPSARREWAEAVRAEADLVPAGWPRVGWLAGGLWLAVKEAEIMRKVVYWLGIGAVAAAAAWAVWLSWHTSSAADALTVTDRVRVLVGVAALACCRGWAAGTAGSARSATASRRGWCGWRAASRHAAWARPSCGWTARSTAVPMARARSACPVRSPPP